MHPVRDHVCEREKGSAHGQEPLLWWRELFHHPPGGGKGLLGSIKNNQYVLCPPAQLVSLPVPLSISCSFYGLHLLRRHILLNASDSVGFTACVLCLLFSSSLRSCTSASIFQTLRPSRWAEDGTGTLTSSPSFSWPTVSLPSLILFLRE